MPIDRAGGIIGHHLSETVFSGTDEKVLVIYAAVAGDRYPRHVLEQD